MVTALASLGWQGHIATGAWWDTGASETTAADLVIVQGAATRSRETASAGERAFFWFLSSSSSSFRRLGGDRMPLSKVHAAAHNLKKKYGFFFFSLKKQKFVPVIVGKSPNSFLQNELFCTVVF